MKRFYKLFLPLLTLTFAGNIMAQQLPQFSQYLHNPYVLNPAASGIEDYSEISLGFRQQWAGFEGAPKTYYISGHTNLVKTDAMSSQYSIPISRPDKYQENISSRKAKHVVGGLIAVDEYGLFKKTSAMASYAYHLPISKNYYAALGLSAGWYGLTFNSGNIVLENPDDNTYADFIANGNNANLFDINAGVYVYSKKSFFGYSIYQIAQNEIQLGNEDSPLDLTDASLNIHHFVTAGYTIKVSEMLDLTPSVLVKYLNPAPVSYDINLKAEFNKKFWLGVSYRNEDAIVAMLGLTINEILKLGYSYDYITSELSNPSNGSHELVLGLMLRKNR